MNRSLPPYIYTIHEEGKGFRSIPSLFCHIDLWRDDLSVVREAQEVRDGKPLGVTFLEIRHPELVEGSDSQAQEASVVSRK